MLSPENSRLLDDEFISIKRASNTRISGEVLVFKTKNGLTWEMGHHQDCCETVELEDIIGDLNDLLNTPILKIEKKVFEPSEEESAFRNGEVDQFTWWTIATLKGYVDFRWYGDNNGYYSIDVDFEEIINEENSRLWDF